MTAHTPADTATAAHVAEAYKRSVRARMAPLPEQPIVQLTGSDEQIEAAVAARRAALRESVLRFPEQRIELNPHTIARERASTHELEKVVFRAEPGSWVTALVYRPLELRGPAPGLVLGSGHGGGKGSLHNQVAAQLYAQLGFVVVVPDTIGEEDRFDPWGLGLRGHRKTFAVDRLNERGRPFIAKAVFDLSRTLDYLLTRDEVDPHRVACAGSSMGGTTTQMLVAADDRFALCLNSAWAADYKRLSIDHQHSTGCCWRLPGTLTLANQEDLFALAAPHTALLVLSGEIDEICPPHGLETMRDRLAQWWQRRGAADRFDCIIRPEAGHRQYHTTLPALRWVRRHFDMDFALPEREDTDETIPLAEIVEADGYKLQPLYDVDRHHRGTRTLNVPIAIREPASTAILTDDALSDLGLRRDDFTIQGWLRASDAPEPQRVTTSPRTLEPHAKGLAGYLRALIAETDAPLDTALPGAPTQRGSDETGDYEDWPIALDTLMLRVHRPKDGSPGETAVLQLPSARTHDAESAHETATGALVAVPDLVRMNDEELLIGESSAAFNLGVLCRCARVLRERCGVERVEVVSALPRLGELLCAVDEAITSLRITAPEAAEASPAIAHRFETVIPGLTRHYRWLDVLLAVAPRPLTLPATYLDDAARAALEASYRDHGPQMQLTFTD